ncbi:MAG: hypothetical protein EP332_04020 [Bacteroidetes bacterium]|nr:MAG: hypothetical protein EP332_04020 [Bacteroidota bacterium]
MVKIRQFYLTTLTIAVLFFTACSDEPRNDYSLSDIPQQTEVRRFDLEFFNMNPNQLETDLAKLKASYPNFWDFYAHDIMQWSDSAIANNARILITHPKVKDLRDTVNMVFGDFKDQAEKLEDGFKRFRHHFPELTVPEVVTAFTEFSYPTATDDSLLVLSLELFLGADYPYYSGFNLPEYKVRRMNKAHLVKFAFEAWFDQQFGEMPIGNRMLDRMLMEGKKLYFMDLMLPEEADSIRSGWTGEQLAWLEKNEFQMWTYYIDAKLLYSTNFQDFGDLMVDAPYTAAPNVPPESAPRIASYSGYRIIKKYMKENPEISLADLMYNVNADIILKESGYRP